MADSEVVESAERWIRRVFPRPWRHDGRAADMVTTALQKANGEGRSALGVFEIADLAIFGLRLRAAPWWQSVPWPARTVTGWAGVLGGFTLAVSATVRPWVVTPEPSAPEGVLPWPTLVLALWCVLAVGVLAGSAGTVRAVAAASLLVVPAGLLSTAPALTPVLAASTSPPARVPLVVSPDLAWGATFYLGLPIWLCAGLALGAAPVVRTGVPMRAVLLGAAGVAGLALTQVHVVPAGVIWFGAPYYAGPFAVGVVVVAAVTTAVLLAVRPRSAPAAVIAAGPWIPPASIQLLGPGHLAVFGWLAAWLAVVATSALCWRRGSTPSPRTV